MDAPAVLEPAERDLDLVAGAVEGDADAFGVDFVPCSTPAARGWRPFMICRRRPLDRN